ncbi:MAG: carbamate kinase [Nocardioides sp.]|uniref:carbamate kinase n=1 Tax=Nocardioides sp. TaxID=35761 RepID=UPI003F092E1B
MATIVVALGGNALLRNGGASAAAQQEVADEASRRLVPLVASGHSLVVVHGNGPQVGNIVLTSERADSEETPAMPLDTCVAMSQGSVGYWLQQALADEFTAEGVPGTAVALVTQTVVDARDPAFEAPGKPIGPFHATRDDVLAAYRHPVEVVEDSGRGWRRVVASPRPLRIVEAEAITALVRAGVTVVAGGGGGVPVTLDGAGLRGVEAVVDKDLTAVLVAELVDADLLVLLTSVPAVMVNFGAPEQRALGDVGTEELRHHLEAGEFAVGSMRPKVEAALQFVDRPGRTALIGEIDEMEDVLVGASGTRLTW